MPILKYISISACLISCSVPVSAQLTDPIVTGSGGQYTFVHYTPKDGLVNSRVRKAYQDSKGRMYFITYGGLSVYDGARFKNYTAQNGLLADMVNDVLQVGDDSLLVATNTCGLNVLVHGQVKQLDIAKNLCPVVNRFLKSNDGNVYATTDDGLYKINRNTFEKLPLVIPGQNIPSIIQGPVIEYGDFLIFSTYDSRKNYGPFLYNKKTGAIADQLPGLNVYSLVSGPGGHIWLSTDKNTMMLDTLALAKGKLELVKPRYYHTKSLPLPGGVLHFNNQQELLLSSAKNTVTRYCKDGTLQPVVLPEFSADFFIDREDVLWVCHDGNGVYKLPGTKFQSVFYPFNNNLSGIRTIGGITANTWWVIMNNGEFILQTGTGPKSFRAIPFFHANFLHTGKNHFYASDLHNLFLAAPPERNEKILHFQKILSLPDTASFGGVSVTDRDGSLIFFETRNLCVVKGGKLLFTSSLLPGDLVEGMHIDKNNRLWVISRYNGLMIFSLHPETPASYLQKEFHFIKEFEEGSPRSMVIDANGIIWVGTRYNGLLGFTFEKDRLKKTWHFQTQDGLTDNFITSLACDKDNNIIIGTQTGIDRLIKTKEKYRLENVTKGNNIFSYINYVWTDAGNNAFAWTKTGDILKMEPVSQAENTAAPELLIEEIKINGKPVASRLSFSRLSHEQRNITFSVAAPSFIDEKQITYSYLLSGGGNNEWSDTTAIADIPLLNLSPGNYTLHVKAFFPSTAYTETKTEFSFSILPPWWQTWWFRVFAGLLITAMLVIAVRMYYRRKLEKQRAMLEKQQAVEKERNRIASDMHDDLGAGLSTIHFLSEKVKRNSFSDVTKDDAEKIAANSNDLVQKMNEIIWAMNEKNDTLEDLLFYTRSYAVEYCEENNLTCLASLPQKVPSIFVSGEIRRNVFLTVKESLHNIVKHANAEKVIIDFSIGTSLQVTIKDDGKGFSENAQSNGNGLRNMQKRMESVNGTFEVLNNNGVMVKIKVPVPGPPFLRR